MMLCRAVTALALVQNFRKGSREKQNLQPGSTAASAGRHNLSLVDLYCHRPHNQIEGKDEARLVLSAQNDTFETLQRPAPDPGATAGLQVRMRCGLIAALQVILDGVNIFFREGSRHSVESDQTRHTRHLQYLHAVAQRQA